MRPLPYPRWALASQQNLTDDYINLLAAWRRQAKSRLYSEWITSGAYQRYPSSPADATQIKANLQQFITLYNRGVRNLTANIPSTGPPRTDALYFQSPLSDATEFTENISKHRCIRRWARFPTHCQQLPVRSCPAISNIAALAGDDTNATTFRGKGGLAEGGGSGRVVGSAATVLHARVNAEPQHSGIAGTRTTWREAMGFAPWLFELPDASYSTAGSI